MAQILYQFEEKKSHFHLPIIDAICLMIILNFQLCLGDISEHPNASEDVASKTYDAEDDVLCDVTGLLNKIIKFTFWLR